MKKLVVSFIFVVGLASTIFAQQEKMFSQYMFNGLFLNPAYAGSHKYYQTTGIFRSQWVGLEGAPKTSMIGADGILKNDKTGIGLIMSYEKVGANEQSEIMGNYAHHVKLGPGHLSLGLRAGVSSYKASAVNIWDKSDVAFTNDVNYFIIPRCGFGTFYYTDSWYVGLAIPSLLAYEPGASFKFDINKNNFTWRHYFLNGGAIFKINDKWKMKPSTLVKYVKAAPPEVDLNFSIMYNDKIWVAASFRTGDALVLLTEYQANSRFRIGYAYDITISKIARYSAGSHEIMIGYDFFKEKDHGQVKFF